MPTDSKSTQASKAFREQVDRDIRRFESAVVKAFSFLESEFGFRRQPPDRRDMNDLRDMAVVIPYEGDHVTLEVEFRPGESLIGAALYELQDGRKPKRVSFYGDEGYARAVNVDSYVSMKSGGTVEPILPRITRDIGVKDIGRIGKVRSELLSKKMEPLIEELARRVRVYCAAILRGDTSEFPAAQQYHKELFQVEE
jgi:hypothetical protein